jgi:hypothetical protein
MDSKEAIHFEELKLSLRKLVLNRGVKYVSELPAMFPKHTKESITKAITELIRDGFLECYNTKRGKQRISLPGFEKYMEGIHNIFDQDPSLTMEEKLQIMMEAIEEREKGKVS